MRVYMFNFLYFWNSLTSALYDEYSLLKIIKSINVVTFFFLLKMTALESADEMEAITAITFLLSLVIKRYNY